ncbi:hypothetical protein FA95DRAFT_1606634 [Auriscalpium vulgare]|uniref:Uncharacterized protein n=1 Tax=Auriscalpium vulgare TaxID=40419 RepID=A0ACB8RRW3_9AGAM|nr:hypothetical protein FA95DRAFT_1606634 [Auriscalpium vulgare]
MPTRPQQPTPPSCDRLPERPSPTENPIRMSAATESSSMSSPTYPPALYQPIHASLAPQVPPHTGHAIWEVVCAPAHPIFTADRLLIVDEESIPVQGTVEEISEIQRGVIAFFFRDSHDDQLHRLVVPVVWARIPAITRVKSLLKFLCLEDYWPVPFNALAGERCTGRRCNHLPPTRPISFQPPAKHLPSLTTHY